MINKLILVLFLLLSTCAIFIEIDNSLTVWIEDNADKKKWEDFTKDFDSSDFVVLAVQNQNPKLTQDFVAMLTDIEKNLRSLEHIERVVSIATVFNEMMDFDEDGFGDDLADLETETSKSFYHKLLVGKDNYYGIFIYFNAVAKNRSSEFVSNIRKITNAYPKYDFHLAGPIILNVALDKMSQSDSSRLFPFAIVFFAILLWLRIRSFTLVVIVLFAHGISIGATLGVMALCGSKLNMLSITIPPLLLILGGAPAIHLLHRIMHHLSFADLHFAIKKATWEIAYPCACSLITTAIAFLSFMVSTMHVIYYFGLWMAIGLLFALLINLYVLPLLISLHESIQKLRVTSCKIQANLSRKKAGLSIILITIVTMISLLFVFSPRREANVLLFLPEDHPLRLDYKEVSDHLTGLFALELVVETDDVNHIPWHWLEQTMLELEKNEGIAKVYGPTTLLRYIFSVSLEEDLEAIPIDANIDMAIISMHGTIKNEWERMVKGYGKSMRFSILVNSLTSQKYQAIIQQIANIQIPPEISWHTTGIIALVEKAQHNLIRLQLESFAVAAGIICLLLFVVVPDKKLALLTLPVNLIPPLITFSLMIVFDVELNAATVMIACIAIGISIDDSLHICHFFHAAKNKNVSERLTTTLQNVKEPVITSSIANAGGFLVLCLAGFVPLQYFGFFTAIGIFIALLCDLILLPALILLFWEKK